MVTVPDKEPLLGLLEIDMLASGEIVKGMVKVIISGEMEIDMLASGEMVKNMVKVLLYMQMEELKNNIGDLIITNFNSYISKNVIFFGHLYKKLLFFFHLNIHLI